MKLNKKSLYRIIDSNFNRAKEGLRVCEDICRFILNLRTLTKRCKDVRHNLTDAIAQLNIVNVIKSRDIERDIGKGSSISELRRESVLDILLANFQRTKESIRVLEEFGKLVDKNVTKELKDIRYKVYSVEKKVIDKF